MKKILTFALLAITSAPALADVNPPPPGRGFGMMEILATIVLLAIAGLGVMRWSRGR